MSSSGRVCLAGSVMLLLCLVPSMTVRAQGPRDPLSLPLFDPSTVTYEGKMSVPAADSQGVMLNYGAGAAGFSEDGTRMFVACRQKVTGNLGQDGRGLIWTGTVPDIGGVSKEIAPCTGLALTELFKIQPQPAATGEICGNGLDDNGNVTVDDGCGYFPLIGGVIEAGGRKIVSGYVTYDANGREPRRTWWVGKDFSSLTGPVEGSVPNGLVMREISRVPPEWQTPLGGDLLVTAGYTSIISRSSYGPSATTLWAKDVGTPGFQMNFLLGCPIADPATGVKLQKCEDRWRWQSPPDDLHYGGAEESAGLFIVPGTRSLVAIEREGRGPMCYGYATRDKSLHGTPYPTAANPSPEGVPWCFSLSDPLNEKGPKAYPYVHLMKLFDLRDLVAVKNGTKKPWDVEPYAVHPMPLPPGRVNWDDFRVGYVGSSAFHPWTRRNFLFRELFPNGKGGGDIEVYGGFVAPQAPKPVTVTLTATPATITRGETTSVCWTTAHAATATLAPDGDALSPVDAGCVDKTPTDTVAYTVTAVGANGSATATAMVAVKDKPKPVPPAFVGRVRTLSTYSVGREVAGIRVTLQVPATMTVPPVGASVVVPLPLVDGTFERRSCTIHSIEKGHYAGTPRDDRVVVQCAGMTSLAIKVESHPAEE